MSTAKPILALPYPSGQTIQPNIKQAKKPVPPALFSPVFRPFPNQTYPQSRNQAQKKPLAVQTKKSKPTEAAFVSSLCLPVSKKYHIWQRSQ